VETSGTSVVRVAQERCGQQQHARRSSTGFMLQPRTDEQTNEQTTRIPVLRSKGQRSGSPGPLGPNADTHRAPYRHIVRMRTYHIPLVVVVVGGNVWRISRPFRYQFAPNTHRVV